MVEYPDSGAVVLQSYLHPRESGGGDSCDHSSESESVTKYKDDDDEDNERDPDASRPTDETIAPVLISVVVAASSDDAREARRAAARLERIGREFQREWVAQGLEQDTDGRSSTPE
jgi:hypothetical protein